MKNIIILLFIILCSIVANSQNSKKETINYYKALYTIDTNEVKKGNHLEMAKKFNIETFISYYLEHGKVKDTKKYGIQNITKLFTNSEYTYFGLTYTYGFLDFFKVETNELTKIDLDRLEGNSIREQFIEQFVPQSDKDKVKRREYGCISNITNTNFSYNYLKISNEILITYKWKITCGFISIINKTYTAKLNLTNYTLTK